MKRAITTITFIAVVALIASAAEAQRPRVRISVGAGLGGYGGGFGGYGGYGGCGGFGGMYGGYGGFGGVYGGYGGYGGAYGGYGGFNNSFNSFNYSQQLFQQQASLTQQIFQQQQQAIIGQIQEAQGRVESLESIKQQMFQRYLSMSDLDKAAVRSRLVNDYLNLDAHGREAWKRDAVVQIILGKDLPRLDGAAQFREMNPSDKVRFKQAMLQEYRSLSPLEQQNWQHDPIVGAILGKNWWLK